MVCRNWHRRNTLCGVVYYPKDYKLSKHFKVENRISGFMQLIRIIVDNL